MDRTDAEMWRIDRTAITFGSLTDEPDDRVYWLTRSPSERWRAIELLRQINYGQARTSARLQRVLEIAEVSRS